MIRRSMMWLNLYGREAVRHMLQNSLKTQKMHFLPVFELMLDSLTTIQVEPHQCPLNQSILLTHGLIPEIQAQSRIMLRLDFLSSQQHMKLYYGCRGSRPVAHKQWLSTILNQKLYAKCLISFLISALMRHQSPPPMAPIRYCCMPLRTQWFKFKSSMVTLEQILNS